MTDMVNNLGWQCPLCGRVFSPSVAECVTDHTNYMTTSNKLGSWDPTPPAPYTVSGPGVTSTSGSGFDADSGTSVGMSETSFTTSATTGSLWDQEAAKDEANIEAVVDEGPLPGWTVEDGDLASESGHAVSDAKAEIDAVGSSVESEEGFVVPPPVWEHTAATLPVESAPAPFQSADPVNTQETSLDSAPSQEEGAFSGEMAAKNPFSDGFADEAPAEPSAVDPSAAQFAPPTSAPVQQAPQAEAPVYAEPEAPHNPFAKATGVYENTPVDPSWPAPEAPNSQ